MRGRPVISVRIQLVGLKILTPPVLKPSKNVWTIQQDQARPVNIPVMVCVVLLNVQLGWSVKRKMILVENVLSEKVHDVARDNSAPTLRCVTLPLQAIANALLKLENYVVNMLTVKTGLFAH